MGNNFEIVDRAIDLVKESGVPYQVLITLERIDPKRGPLPGWHSFYRGGELRNYDTEVQLCVILNLIDYVAHQWPIGFD